MTTLWFLGASREPRPTARQSPGFPNGGRAGKSGSFPLAGKDEDGIGTGAAGHGPWGFATLSHGARPRRFINLMDGRVHDLSLISLG